MRLPLVATCTGAGALLALLLFYPEVEVHPRRGPTPEVELGISLMLAGIGFIMGLTLDSLRHGLGDDSR
jgi:hypothetical protein